MTERKESGILAIVHFGCGDGLLAVA